MFKNDFQQISETETKSRAHNQAKFTHFIEIRHNKTIFVIDAEGAWWGDGGVGRSRNRDGLENRPDWDLPGAHNLIISTL